MLGFYDATPIVLQIIFIFQLQYYYTIIYELTNDNLLLTKKDKKEKKKCQRKHMKKPNLGENMVTKQT